MLYVEAISDEYQLTKLEKELTVCQRIYWMVTKWDGSTSDMVQTEVSTQTHVINVEYTFVNNDQNNIDSEIDCKTDKWIQNDLRMSSKEGPQQLALAVNEKTGDIYYDCSGCEALNLDEKWWKLEWKDIQTWFRRRTSNLKGSVDDTAENEKSELGEDKKFRYVFDDREVNDPKKSEDPKKDFKGFDGKDLKMYSGIFIIFHITKPVF